MNRKAFYHIKGLIFVGLCCFALAGCYTNRSSQRNDSNAVNQEVHDMESKIQTYSAERDVYEREKEKYAKIIQSTETNQAKIERIERVAYNARQSVCSDKMYLKALESYGIMASNRMEAAKAELQVYRDSISSW